MKNNEIKEKVREGYGKIARESSSCCCASASCCSPLLKAEDISRDIGYTGRDMDSVPDGANLGLGCGNPIATASIKKGETIIDLGSGAGFDSFLAANATGRDGKVIGVDMTPDMVGKARENALKSGYDNVEFILADIEDIPLADNIADLIISNCVINLAPDKKKVFSEAYRLLKGRRSDDGIGYSAKKGPSARGTGFSRSIYRVCGRSRESWRPIWVI